MNTPSQCTLNNGTATVTAAGGTLPYTYSWLPTGGNGTIASSLAPGNYTVSVSDNNGCTTTALATIQSIGNIIANVSSLPIICHNQSNGMAITTVTGGTLPYNYQWDNGSTNDSLINIGVGNYCVTATDANGCTDTACIGLSNPVGVQAEFTSTPTETSLDNPVIYFYNQTQSAASWLWNFGDNSSAIDNNPVHTYSSLGTFPVTLIITTSQGCTDTVIHYVVISNGFTFYAPNAFSPNHNSTNDYFMPKGSGWDNSSFEMWIFDRWGNMIYYTHNASTGWDGKANNGIEVSEIDVYVWKVQLSDIYGDTHHFMGSVSIVK